ncbi:16S rRNA (cytosine(1402)-N(4))-methyltransferase RsmH [Legionella gresilensis]|uniref:16S rRNA (cytosine(1402)-N(4))-methyltransferase RsmH n=1 Tax=Legionella gresilensis TaxID=91823 RepID=UPI0010413709|nr:16S rRNA (cytosine(1402)-N(4))-methyltransferase RsmH [Legionella gresilensis]
MMSHQSVLLHESIESLAIKADGVYIDGTFGRGGHSQAILAHLSSQGRLIAIDKDPQAVEFANCHFTNDPRFQIFQGSFADLPKFAKQANVYQRIDGILLDLGVSSPQLDDANRGFSFMQAGPLDMRMDIQQSLDAATYINHAKLDDMAKIFWEYGEERFARRIAKAIIDARTQAPITSTTQLAEIIKQANPKWEKHKHPATRVFQAIRIHINNELDDLKKGLKNAFEVLGKGGRLVVISFHSLEDRIVKQFMRDMEIGHQLPFDIPIRAQEELKSFKRVGKAIKPEEKEIRQNIRSRSAILRIGEKIV